MSVRTGFGTMNRLLLLAAAPFFGMLLVLLYTGTDLALRIPERDAAEAVPGASAAADVRSAALIGSLDSARHTALEAAASLRQSASLYASTNRSMKQIAAAAAVQASHPLLVYDRRISRKLGMPSEHVQTGKITAQLYKLTAQHFKGYALKVRLKSPKAMKMVLGYDTVGKAETTLSAARRYKALAGVNAGGFADDGGRRYPLSTTVMGGRYIAGGFEPSRKDLFFVGLNEEMKLIGGKYASRRQLDAESPRFGASFVPILMKNGVPQRIPAKWAASPLRAPRTVVANYKDDQLLFIITDGYNEKGSSGATLKELQILLQRFGVKDAYNLDGGGSSSLVFKGRVVNRPSDGRLRGVPTHFLFFK